MPRSDDIVARWLASKEEDGCKPSTLRQYGSMVQTTLDALAHVGRPTDPRVWTAADARWLRGRFSQEHVRISIVANLTRFAGSTVFGEVRSPRRKRRHQTPGPSSDHLRALLGINERSRRPKLVVLLGLDRGPGDTEWLQLPAEYIDLAGNRRLLRRNRVRGSIVVDPGESRKERARALLKDDRVKRWYAASRLLDRQTAWRLLGNLSQLLDGLALSIDHAFELGRDEPARLETIIYQWVEKRRKEGRQPGTLKNTLDPLRVLFTRESVPFHAWPKFHRLVSPTLHSERVPTSRELRLICAQLDTRSRVAALLMAQAGLRPGAFCRNDTRSDIKALQLKHLPDLKLSRRRYFERIPFRIDVPAGLSKVGRSYLTFGGQELADTLLAYFNERTRSVIDPGRRGRTRQRERLTPESYVIGATHSGEHPRKNRFRGGDPVREKIHYESIRRGMRKVQPEGVHWRPYVLRDYFSTRLLLAEFRNLIHRDVREYMLGHDTRVAGRYNLGKRLPDVVVVEMRSMYARSLPFLVTPRPVRNVEDVRGTAVDPA